MRASRVVKRLQKQAAGMWRSRRRRLALVAALVVLFGSLGLAGAVLHNRQQAQLAEEEIEMEVDAGGDWEPPSRPPPPPPSPHMLAEADESKPTPVGTPREVRAAWYDVPDDSLAKRRAGKEELTAAHNKLPLGTLVRVTHLSNGKSTLVRITDRGIHDKRIKLDVCREAAEELGMVSKGIARVKMQIVREEGGGAASAVSRNSAPQR